MTMVSGILFAVQQRIVEKLLAIGATSREQAVTAQEACLDSQELNWLHYVAGGLFSKVKKTEDKRYYIIVYKPTRLAI
jgi:hypothetical protein